MDQAIDIDNRSLYRFCILQANATDRRLKIYVAVVWQSFGQGEISIIKDMSKKRIPAV